MMERQLMGPLMAWKARSVHKPVLLRGARQVGKTHLVTQLGKRFSKFHEINFELFPEYKRCFTTLRPENILNAIAMESGEQVVPGESLLFLDEIQECPMAIQALRYFKEKLPALHVIGAGSLLEFAMHEEDFRMPVGRVRFMYLKPLSFREYLRAHQYTLLDEKLSAFNLASPPDEATHTKLLSLVKEYIVLGGMPEVHQTYLENRDLIECQQVQTALLNTYRRDFGKYAPQDMHKYLQAVFLQSASLIGQQVRYVDIDREMRSRSLKRAIELLSQVGVIQCVYATSALGLPLEATINEKKFKILYLDVGLANRLSRVDINTLLQADKSLINRGQVIEQFVGQELTAYTLEDEEPQLYYWTKEKVGSMAEVDFILQHHDRIIPIEVKAGATGRLKSLKVFMAEKKSPLGLQISEKALQFKDNILSVPFYLISEIPRLLEERV